MKFDELKQGFASFWDQMAEGWQHLRTTASNALTGFRPNEQTDLPAKHEVDDRFFMPSRGWSMLGGDVFEDEQRVVVRLEVPGLQKDDLEVEVEGDVLVVSGEKRFQREENEGRYRVLQCAYGSFRRVVPLPVAVRSDEAKASYRDGVLRVELPKATPEPPRRQSVKVD